MVYPTCPTFLSNSRKFLKETWSIFGKGKPLANFAEIKNDQYCQFTKNLIHQIFIVCLKCESCHKSMMVATSRSNSFNQFLAKVSILYSLKASKNLLFSGVFRAYKMRNIGQKWADYFFTTWHLQKQSFADVLQSTYY